VHVHQISVLMGLVLCKHLLYLAFGMCFVRQNFLLQVAL